MAEHSEIQFISKLGDDPTRISFEISYSTVDAVNMWDLCTTGGLELLPKMPQGCLDIPSGVSNDFILFGRAQRLYPVRMQKFENIAMSSGKIHGCINASPDTTY